MHIYRTNILCYSVFRAKYNISIYILYFRIYNRIPNSNNIIIVIQQ